MPGAVGLLNSAKRFQENQLMPQRLLPALCAGLAIGAVVMEALFAGFNALTPDTDLPGRLAAGAGLTPAHTLALLAIWFLAAFLSAAMAAAMARLSGVGWLAGVLWMVPTQLMAGLGGLSATAMAASALVCLVAAWAGGELARWTRPRPTDQKSAQDAMATSS